MIANEILIFVYALTVSATSAVDLDTDRAIQDIMGGSEFSDVTVITIAYVFLSFCCFRFVKRRFSHRLNTILNSDRIIVMDSGKESFFFVHYFHSLIFSFVFFRLLNLIIRPTCLRISHQFSILLFKRQV